MLNHLKSEPQPKTYNRDIFYNREIAAKVLSWDQLVYDAPALRYQPKDIEAIAVQEDIAWYKLGDTAIPIAISDFYRYWDSIQEYEAGVSPVAVKKADLEPKPKSSPDDPVTVVWQNDRSGFTVNLVSGHCYNFTVLALWSLAPIIKSNSPGSLYRGHCKHSQAIKDDIEAQRERIRAATPPDEDVPSVRDYLPVLVGEF